MGKARKERLERLKSTRKQIVVPKVEKVIPIVKEAPKVITPTPKTEEKKRRS